MLPEELSSRYKRYKADSQAVASWLVTTAEKCRYQLPPSETTGTSTKSTRLKGKARRLARERKDVVSEKQSRPYLLKIDDFIPLAQWIANSRRPRISVPANFAYNLQQAIAERKRFQKHYRSMEEANSATDGHGHFIGILESVRDILRPNLEPGVKFEKESRNEDLDMPRDLPGLANIFSHLEVEDTSGESMGRVVERAASAAEVPRPVEVVVDPDSDLLEKFRVKALFWSDVHRIRILVREIWQNYKTGMCDLAAAAITTNTAIDFVRGLHEDFERSWKGDANLDLERTACLRCLMLQDTKEEIHDSGIDLDVPCLIPGWLTISSWTAQFKNDPKDFMPTVLPNLVGLFHTAELETSKVKQDVNLAFGVVPEYCILLKYCSSVQAEHGLIHGLREQMQQDRPLFWLAFAVQIFIDIRKILQEDIVRGFEDLCREASSIRHRIKEVLDFEKEANGTPLTDTNDKALKAVLELMDRYTINDFVGELREEMSANPNGAQHIEDFYLLRRDPIWCGLLLYNFRMVAHEGSIYRANSFMSIIVVAHLYNAQKQAGLLDDWEWANMEHILTTHGKELFVGAEAPSLAASSKNLLLAMGMSATELARARRPSSDLRFHEPRKLGGVAPMTWLFKARYCDNHGRTGLEPGHVVEVLRKVVATQGKALERRPPIEVVLVGLLAVLNVETKLIRFDYFQMHMTCWQLLCRLHEETGAGITDWSEIYNERGARELPSLVLCLGLDLLRATVGRPNHGSANLMDSAKIVKEMIGIEEVPSTWDSAI